MKKSTSLYMAAAAIVCGAMFYTSCSNKVDTVKQEPITQGNPYLPLWEHIPDGEPYVFEDPDNPGKQRLYIYGSHDNLKTMYCGRDQVVWSAPVEDLTQWRYEGEILVVNKNAKGEPFDSAGTADVLYAPDVTLVTDSIGKKTYYLFPNDQTGFRNGLIAKSDSPKGPFEVCNWNADDPNKVDGIYGFDPAVFVDDDGRVYGYWGFEHSMAAEIDPATMCTVKPGTEVVDGMVSGRNEPGVFRFFEASSLRKIKDKYVFIYSRFTEDGEFGLPTSNYTLAYAYSDKPLGPWTYGGTIIDGRAREKDEQGNVIASAVPDGNTHGSICEINGQWYVFYHRMTNHSITSRRACVERITILPDGTIPPVEMTSLGFEDALNPYQVTPAEIACVLRGGCFITEKDIFTRVITEITDGCVMGYKYFDFGDDFTGDGLTLALKIRGMGMNSVLRARLDDPENGPEIGVCAIGTGDGVYRMKTAPVTGRHALYLTAEQTTEGWMRRFFDGRRLFELESFVFMK